MTVTMSRFALSGFVVADPTGAKGILQELGRIVPFLPSVLATASSREPS